MTQTKITRRAVLYTRISLTDDDSTSLTRQEKDLMERADRESWTIVAHFSDDGISGAKARENAAAALKMLADGEADVLAVWKFDRWSRMGLSSVADLIEVLDSRPGSEFHALQDGLSSTQPAWRIIAAVLAEVARIERENIKMRVASSVRELRRTGRYAGGQITWGYQSAPNPDGPGRVLIPNPDEVRLISEAANRVLTGESTYSICRDWNARGIKARKGGQWTVASLQKILREETLLGRVKVNGRILRDEDSQMPLQMWEPVITLDLWQKVQIAMTPKPMNGPRRKRTRLLSGTCFCGECGARMIPRVAGSGTVSYSCPSKAKGKNCVGVSILADNLDDLIVSGYVIGVAGDSPWRERSETPVAAIELTEVNLAMAELSRQIMEPGANRAKIAEQLDKLDSRRTELESSNATEVRWIETGETLEEHWNAAELPERQRILSVAIRRVVISKGGRAKSGTIDRSRIRVEWQEDFMINHGELDATEV